MSVDTSSLTKGLYHMAMAKQYFEAFKASVNFTARNIPDKWLNKINFIEGDIVSSLSEESRELYREEIKKGDVIFLPSISEKVLEMTPKQRELVESFCDGLLKGTIVGV